MSGVLLFWQYMLGFRQVAARFTKDLVFINQIHKWFGIYGFLFILMHPTALLISYAENWFSLFWPEIFTQYEIYIFVGKTAFGILAFIWFTSAIMRTRLPFRFWKMLHYLVYIILPLVFLHSLNVGTTLKTTWIVWYWYLLITIFICLLIYKLFFQSGKFRKLYKVTSLVKTTEQVLHITFMPLGDFIQPALGQFVYIQTHDWGESHPFTVTHFDSKTGELSIAPKIVGKFTKALQTLGNNAHVKIDGPYGVFTQEVVQDQNPVFLAAGIGITPFLRHSAHPKSKITLLYCNQSLDTISFANELEEYQKANPNFRLVHVLSRQKVEKPGYENGRLTAKIIEKYTQNLQEPTFYICGPQEFIKDTKKMLRDLQIPSKRVKTEEFSL